MFQDGHDCMDAEGRATQEAKAEDDKNAFASNTDKNILLILEHPVNLVLVLPHIGLNSVFPA